MAVKTDRERDGCVLKTVGLMQIDVLSNRNQCLWPILLLSGLLFTETNPPQKSLAELSVKTEDGIVISLASLRKNQDILVLVFVSSNCPVTSLYLERIKGIWYNYRNRGVPLYAVGGNSDDSITQVRTTMKSKDLDLPIVWDEGHMAAKIFGIEFTPEALVFGKNDEVLYRGKIDDFWRDESQVKNRYLDTAITAALEGKKTIDHIDDPFMGSKLR